MTESPSKASTTVLRIDTDVHLYDDPEDVNITPLLNNRFDKAITLKRKDFINQGLLKPNLGANEDIVKVVHEELQPYQVNDAEEIERLKELVVNSDETPGDFTEDGDLGSNFDSLFYLAFDSLMVSKKAGIVEPRFQICTERDILTWTSMIIALAQHGLVNETIELFEEMLKSNLKLDHITYVGVLYACTHVALVEQGKCYFNLMKNVHHIEPTPSHYACMIDLFGHAGLMEDAYNFIKNMPIELDVIV